MLKVKDLCKEFDVKGVKNKLVAVDRVSFSIGESETYGLIGESGSGKTTVGRLLLRLIEPTSGSMQFHETEYGKMSPKKLRSLRRNMQMVFQDPYYSLNPSRTVWDTVYSACQVKDGNKRERVRQALERVYIDDDLYDQYPHQISMGQQQRVGIARAIVSSPKFIVLDEPTSSLDLSVRGEIMKLLSELQKDLNISYLFISHDLSTVRYFCHKVSIMYLGQIVEMGSVEQIFNQSSHPYSRALLASVMHPDPSKKRSQYQLEGEIPSPINLPRSCYLANRCPEATELCFQKQAELKEIEPGHFVRCHHR